MRMNHRETCGLCHRKVCVHSEIRYLAKKYLAKVSPVVEAVIEMKFYATAYTASELLANEERDDLSR